jgi:mRNA-degrading endonuclease RelE of RelBE toxin-antitoxin system
MAFKIISYHDCFSRQLNHITSKYSRSKKKIEAAIQKVKTMPLQGDEIRGYGSLHLRKIRLPLKAYDIGKRGGLRVIYMVDINHEWIIMVNIYSKRENNPERDHIKKTKENLKSILASFQ